MDDSRVCAVKSLNFGKNSIDTDFREVQIIRLHGNQYWLGEYHLEIYAVTQNITKGPEATSHWYLKNGCKAALLCIRIVYMDLIHE